MENGNQRAPANRAKFLVGILWCGAVFIAYHLYNTPYYLEKLSVFSAHLKSLVG